MKETNWTLESLFGAVLRDIRLERGISQEKLALESGYHRTYISLLERGQKSPSLNTIFELTRVLGVPASEVVERVEARLVRVAKQTKQPGHK